MSSGDIILSAMTTFRPLGKLIVTRHWWDAYVRKTDGSAASADQTVIVGWQLGFSQISTTVFSVIEGLSMYYQSQGME